MPLSCSKPVKEPRGKPFCVYTGSFGPSPPPKKNTWHPLIYMLETRSQVTLLHYLDYTLSGVLSSKNTTGQGLSKQGNKNAAIWNMISLD